VAFVPADRHLQRAKDLADGRYFEQLTVYDLARAAGLSRAHFSREFRRAFGESPHAYLLTRRLERAASLLCATDQSVAEICLRVGLRSVGVPPAAYRAAHPPAADRAMIPACVLRAHLRPRYRTFREDSSRAPA
jgi:AraC-like DNA-binding protein